MNDKILDMLRDLANTIGTTVDKLWAALVAQAKVSVVLNGLLILSVIVAFIAAYRIYRAAAKFAETKTIRVTTNYAGTQGYERKIRPFEVMFDTSMTGDKAGTHRYGLAFSFVAVMAYAFGGLVGIMASAGPKFVTALLNPNFWALEKLTSMLGMGGR